MNEQSLFDEISGRHILNISKGHGTFLTLDLEKRDDEEEPLHIWIYLADWALSKNGQEILSSESSDIEESLREIRDGFLAIIQKVLRLDDEIHFVLEGGFAIEVWQSDSTLAGEDVLIVYRGDKHIFEIKAE